VNTASGPVPGPTPGPPVAIEVDGRTHSAPAGASVAAALVNAGVWAFRRSVRGDPRGPLCGMGTCHECRVSVDGTPHRRACLLPVAAGMRVRTDDPAPRAPAPRAPAPRAPAPRAPSRSRPAELVEADVVVVGAGPAGIAAATAAAGGGREVVVLDESPREGGQVWRHRTPHALPREARQRIERFRGSGARIVHAASVVASPEAGLLLAERDGTEPNGAELDGGPLRVRWREGLVLAVGARERFLPFPGWTLPGVVGVGGAQALIKAGMDVRGLRATVAGSGPLLLPVAALLAKGGARIPIVAEQASARRVAAFALGLLSTPGKLADALRYRTAFAGTPYRTGWWVRAASGAGRVREVTLTDGSRDVTHPCDLLAVGYGLVPATELPRALGCEAGPDGVVVDPWQETTVSGVFCAGEPTGVAGVGAAVLEGRIAGLAATGRRDASRALLRRRDRERRFARRLGEAFRLRDALRDTCTPDTLLCRCEDVEAGRVEEAVPARRAKLETRCGMGPCQGRVCGPAGAFLLGWDADSVRPPVIPARLDTLVAGDP
jgi:D-hydroxyproline dehydrogenase subunit alpha